MEIWKRNLYVLCFAMFMCFMAMSMIMPFLPLFLKQELGVTDEDQVTFWAGIIFGANFLSAGIVSPLWGRLADRYGRKIMVLRSGYMMSIIVGLTGQAASVWQLFFLRLLNGTVAGIMPASTALVASTAPKERAGWAQGMLQSCGVSGTIMGPFIGGILADWVGFRWVFSVTGVLILLATILIHATVKEQFVPPEGQPKTSFREDTRTIFSTQPLPALFCVTVMIQFALFSINPVLALYVERLIGSSESVAFYAGFVFAAAGMANVISSPQLGKLGDRIGNQKVLLFCLIGASLLFIPQAFVTSVWQLVALRFLVGLCVGGLIPSVSALIRKSTPRHMISRVYGFNNSFLSMGSMLGPSMGGILAGVIGLNGVFLFTSALLMINAAWVGFRLWRMPQVSEIEGI
jgi:DHA1 family multidrug resistance protein-like MFS transporter